MMLRIEDDFSDEIVKASLLQTYLSLKKSLKNKNLHEDDVVVYKNLVPALEVVCNWYFYDFKQAVKDAGKKK